MARVISVYLPTWPTDRLRRTAGKDAPPADVPLVMAGSENGRRVVAAADEVARSRGLRIGMPLTKAQAVVPDLVVKPIDTAADDAALERLALWVMQRFSPVVAVDLPDGIVIDSTGADHLHGGEEAMLEALSGRLIMEGVAVRAAVADTWAAAYGLARYGASFVFIAQPGATKAVVSGLPLEALRVSPSVTAGLRELGFERIGDLFGQPRAPLTRRFGLDLCRRLDQLLGEVPEPIDPLRPPELIEARRSFAEPIGAAETIERYVRELVIELCALLEKRGVGARRVDLLCHRVDGRIETARIGLAKAVRDPKPLTRLLVDKIETIAPGFGIEIMSLAASLAEPLYERQSVNVLGEPEAADLSGLIDALANRVGAKAIYRFVPVASDVPERAVGRVPALAEEAGATWPDHWPRPARLLPRPEPIETMALLPDHPPNWISWRGVRRRVRRADGPERVFGEWWKRDAELMTVRDYYRIEDDAGERFWIYRSGDGEDPATGSHRWFLHGIFA